LSKKGKGAVTAKDFDKNADVEIANPDLQIATITDAGATFEMEVTIGKGRGYVPVTEKETKDLALGTIAIDSLYTPIRDVGYAVEMTRVGDVTNYEKLTVTIETNGTIAPKEALSQATKILMDHFVLILDVTGEQSAAAAPDADAPDDDEAADEEEEKTGDEE